MSDQIQSRLTGVRRVAAATTIFTACALLGTAWILFKPGTLGHHWDWLIPPSAEELRTLARTSGTAWQDVSLGSFVSYRSTSALLAMALGVPGFIGANGAFVTKGLVLCSLIGSCLSMYWLISDLYVRQGLSGDPHRYGILGGILYGFAPFAYDQIVAGDQLEFIAYALAPFAVLCIVNSADGWPMRRRAWIAGAAISLAIMSASPQTAAITSVVGAALAWSTARSSKALISAICAIGLSTALLCAYWILPVALSGGAIANGVTTTPAALADAGLLSMSNLYQTLTATAEPGLFYFHALTGPLAVTFAFAWIAAWALIAAALIARASRLLKTLAATYVVGALIPLGGAPIIGPVIVAAYHAAMPASLLFRTAQHLVFLPALAGPPLIALSVASLEVLRTRYGRTAAVLCTLAICAGFVARSDFLALIGPYQDGSDADAIAAIAPDPSLTRLLFLPASGSYYFHPGVYDYFFEAGDDPTIRFSPMPAVAVGFKWTPYHRSQALEQALDELVLQTGRADDKALLFKLASIGFVNARSGVMPAGGIWVDRFDFAEAVRTTDTDPSLRRLYSDGSSAGWENSIPVPRVYAPDCTVDVPPQADAYDLLPWSRVTARCRRPAFVASAQSDEIVVSAADAAPRSSAGTTSNRWDAYYFGSQNVRPAIQFNSAFRHHGAALRFKTSRDGVYDVYLRLETGSGLQPVAVSVDGGTAVCVDPRMPSTRTEDTIEVRRGFMRAGTHVVGFGQCRKNIGSLPFQVLGIDVVPDDAIRFDGRPASVSSLVRHASDFSVTLHGSGPTYVVLNDAFDDRWIARQNGSILPHVLANGYANAWRVQRPLDGPLTIEFLPQRNVVAGFTLSAVALAGLIAFALSSVSSRPWRRYA